jgi:hypothetical protein
LSGNLLRDSRTREQRLAGKNRKNQEKEMDKNKDREREIRKERLPMNRPPVVPAQE